MNFSLDMRFRSNGHVRNSSLSNQSIKREFSSIFISLYELNFVLQRDYVRYVAYFTEKSVKLMNKTNQNTGKPIAFQTLIIDFEHFSVNQVSYKPCKFIISSLCRRYIIHHQIN